MRKKIVLYTLFAICAIGSNAQEMTPEEATALKKEMNEIKRSEDYIVAEGLAEYLSDDGDQAVSMAQHQSMMKLRTQVVTVFAQHLHMTPDDVEAIWDVIEDKCQNVEITAGDVTRSFFYVSKEVVSGFLPDVNLFPEWKKKRQEREAEREAEKLAEAEDGNTLVEQPVAVTQEVVNPEEEALTADNVDEESEVEEDEVAAEVEEMAEAETEESKTATQNQVVVRTQVTVVEQTVEEVKQEAATTPAEPVVETPEREEVPAAPVVESVTPVEETPVETPVQESPVVKVEVPPLCQKMLDKKNMETLRKFLDTEKAYEKLIYGPERYMRRASECYIVILDKNTKNIVTVLDKGITERMNFVTGKMDTFSSYQMAGGYMAVFVQEL